MNTWPGGRRHAMTQGEHARWNARNYPGTQQLCGQCGEPTGRCEEDSLYADGDGGTRFLCERCNEQNERFVIPIARELKKRGFAYLCVIIRDDGKASFVMEPAEKEE